MWHIRSCRRGMMETLLMQSALNGVTLALFYMLIGVGLALLYGMANILYSAHGDTYMLGAVLSYYLVAKAKIPWILAIPIVVVAFGLLGPVIERVFFRRVRDIGTSSLVVGLGLMFLIEGTTYSFYGLRAHAVPSGLLGSISILGASLTYERLVLIAGCVLLLVVLQFFLIRTKYGMAMRASVQSKIGAFLQGISDNNVAALAFAIGTALAGAAGALVAPLYNVTVGMGMQATIWGWLILGVGGLGSITGCIIASFIFGFLQSFIATFIGPVVAQVVLFAAITVFLAIRPQGLMGESRGF